MSGTRTHTMTVVATAVVILMAFAGVANSATLRMSGTFIRDAGQINIPLTAVPAADTLISVTNKTPGHVVPDNTGPAQFTIPALAFTHPPDVTRNFPIPGTLFAQLFTDFTLTGPNTTVPTITSTNPNLFREGLTAKRAFGNFAWCPGATANPACATHKTVGQGAGANQGTQHGIIKYTAATPAFSGTARMVVNGTASVTAIVGATPKFSHQPVGGGGAVQGGVAGGHYAVFNTNYLGAGVQTTGAVLSGGGAILAPGTVVGAGASPVNNFNFGMPWTVGQIYAKTTLGANPTTITDTGYDTRTVGGRGKIQMVSMQLAVNQNPPNNTFIGTSTMTLDIASGQLTPALSPTGLAALGGLLVLGGGYLVRKRLS